MRFTYLYNRMTQRRRSCAPILWKLMRDRIMPRCVHTMVMQMPCTIWAYWAQHTANHICILTSGEKHEHLAICAALSKETPCKHTLQWLSIHLFKVSLSLKNPFLFTAHLICWYNVWSINKKSKWRSMQLQRENPQQGQRLLNIVTCVKENPIKREVHKYPTESWFRWVYIFIWIPSIPSSTGVGFQATVNCCRALLTLKHCHHHVHANPAPMSSLHVSMHFVLHAAAAITREKNSCRTLNPKLQWWERERERRSSCRTAITLELNLL